MVGRSKHGNVMNPLDILDAIKKHGFLAVGFVFTFVYFQNQINRLENKYEDCMNDRITEAYRMRTSQAFDKCIRWCAILPDNPVGKIKKYV
jgi:hypothetical protein